MPGARGLFVGSIRAFFSSWDWAAFLVLTVGIGPLVLLLRDPFWLGVLIPCALGPALVVFVRGVAGGCDRVPRFRWNYKARNGLCVMCGYDLKGNTTGRCPECGTPWGHNAGTPGAGAGRPSSP